MMRRGALLAAASLVLTSFIAEARFAAVSFDTPLKIERIPLSPDPLNPRAKPMLSCFYYYGKMVKQIDRGEKGAELSILRFDSNEHGPECTETSVPGEKAIDGWSGYFKGVRASYLFLDADDGWNNGTGFAVFSFPDGSKLFEDVAEKRINTLVSSNLMLRYRRVYGAPCSLYADREGCWTKVKAETTLAGEPPNCSAAYEADIARAGADKDAAAANPTIITYEVWTTVGNGRTVIEPLREKTVVTCQPAM